MDPAQTTSGVSSIIACMSWIKPILNRDLRLPMGSLGRRLPYLLAVSTVLLGPAALPFGKARAETTSHVSFYDSENDRVEIARDVDPATDTLVNTITVTKPDGRQEVRTVTTSPDPEGGYTIAETHVSFGSQAVHSVRHVAGPSVSAAGARRGANRHRGRGAYASGPDTPPGPTTGPSPVPATPNTMVPSPATTFSSNGGPGPGGQSAGLRGAGSGR